MYVVQALNNNCCIYMYVHVYMYTHIHTCMYNYMYVQVPRPYLYNYVHTYVHVNPKTIIAVHLSWEQMIGSELYTCTCTCTYICTMYVVCMYMYILICTLNVLFLDLQLSIGLYLEQCSYFAIIGLLYMYVIVAVSLSGATVIHVAIITCVSNLERCKLQCNCSYHYYLNLEWCRLLCNHIHVRIYMQLVYIQNTAQATVCNPVP